MLQPLLLEASVLAPALQRAQETASTARRRNDAPQKNARIHQGQAGGVDRRRRGASIITRHQDMDFDEQLELSATSVA